MSRNLIPRRGLFSGRTDERQDWWDAVDRLSGSVSAWADAITSFLTQELPRGPVPQGPKKGTLAAKADCVLVTWVGEITGATVDFYSIWRAAAGTGGAPTTPALTSALRVDVKPSGRADRTPKGSGYQWYDLNFSAADRAAGNRYRYWVASIDNEYRESTPVDFGIVQIPA